MYPESVPMGVGQGKCPDVVSFQSDSLNSFFNNLFFLVEIQSFDTKKSNHEACELRRMGQSDSFSMGKPRQLYGIRISTLEDQWVTLREANWTVEYVMSDNSTRVINVNISEKEEETSNRIHLILVLENSSRVDNVRLTYQVNVTVCAIEALVFYDTCGKPDTPLHGRVDFDQINTAAYHCVEGLILEPNRTRQCVDGSWNGPVPACNDCTAARYYLWLSMLLGTWLFTLSRTLSIPA
jgi:hypothetical protein